MASQDVIFCNHMQAHWKESILPEYQHRFQAQNILLISVLVNHLIRVHTSSLFDTAEHQGCCQCEGEERGRIDISRKSVSKVNRFHQQLPKSSKKLVLWKLNSYNIFLQWNILKSQDPSNISLQLITVEYFLRMTSSFWVKLIFGCSWKSKRQ